MPGRTLSIRPPSVMRAGVALALALGLLAADPVGAAERE